MSDFADFKASIAEYANRQDWSDALLTSFVRDAESKFNAELKIDRMIKTAINTVDHSCANLPDDWIEADFVLIQNPNAPQGWIPIQYQQRDRFFRLPSTAAATRTSVQFESTFGYYTIEGRTIFFGGPPDAVNGTAFRMAYFAEVPVFSDTQDSWLYTKYESMYRFAALMHADMHAIGEEDKAGGLKMLVEDQIKKLNDVYFRSKASGSIVARGHRRSFG